MSDFNGIAATHLEHVKADSANAINSREAGLFFIAVDDGRHVAESHLQAIAPRDDQIREIRHRFEARIYTHRLVVLTNRDVAHGRVDIVGANRVQYLIDANTARAKLCRVRLDLNFTR